MAEIEHEICYKNTEAELRRYEPDPDYDLGNMYVLDVFGHSLLIRERGNDVYVHVDSDGQTPMPVSFADKPLVVELNNSGEQTYGHVIPGSPR